MKKSIYLWGLAVVALSSCTQSDVVEMPDSRAIGFSSFVNNNVRDVTEVETGSIGTGFYVFGNYGTGGSWTGQAFNNEISTSDYYWQAGQTYRFGAYANGVNGKIDDASFDASTQTLAFPSYTPDDAKDLIAATTGDIDADTYIGNKNKVGLTFKHLLSQVKLTFTTDAAAVYNMTITNVKINGAVSTSTATYANNVITWNPSKASEASTGKDGYTYDALSNAAKISSGVSCSQSKLVIPQSETNNLTVTFTATISGEATGSATFTANLGHAISGITENTWTNGHRYNYIAEVPLNKVIDSPDDKVKIEFTPTVEGWEDKGAVNAPVTKS